MKVLVACEKYGKVRDVFRRKGHEAWSCDLENSKSWPDYHLKGDIIWWMNNLMCKWDLLIAFPPCTDLSVSGARYWAEKRADGRQQKAIKFFMKLAKADIPRIAIENPVGIMSTFWRKPDQIIQPYQFGHPESKKTCLWLKNLPLLRPTKILKLPAKGYWNNQTPSGQNKLSPSKKRAEIRGVTYDGIAEAMAEQWG